MSEEKKYTNNEEICEEATKLTEEDLENVTGGVAQKQFYVGEDISVSAGIAYLDITTYNKLN